MLTHNTCCAVQVQWSTVYDRCHHSGGCRAYFHDCHRPSLSGHCCKPLQTVLAFRPKLFNVALTWTFACFDALGPDIRNTAPQHSQCHVHSGLLSGHVAVGLQHMCHQMTHGVAQVATVNVCSQAAFQLPADTCRGHPLTTSFLFQIYFASVSVPIYNRCASAACSPPA